MVQREAAQTVLDGKTGMVFPGLAETRRRYASVLQTQVEKLNEDPHRFDREDADPFKPLHVGP